MDGAIATRGKRQPHRFAVAVSEASDLAASRAREAVLDLGYRLLPEVEPRAIEERAEGSDPPAILLCAMPEKIDLARCLAALPRPPIVIASLMGPHKTALERLSELPAELFTVKPHTTESLSSVLYGATYLVLARRRERALLDGQARLQDELQRTGHSSQITGFQHFDFFKKILATELKRAKRYHYSLAICMVALDGGVASSLSEPKRNELRSLVARVVTRAIRDVDFPVDYSKERMLLFLPYADEKGAREVGQRIVATVRQSVGVTYEGALTRATVSIGIAARTSEEDLSFAKLVRDANSALKAAQLKGGNRALCRGLR